jgi:hypothetical protein
LWPVGWYNHRLPSRLRSGKDQARQQARRIGRAKVPDPALGSWERLFR